MEKVLQPHQERVVTEAEELRVKATALGAFILDNPIYQELSTEERYDLKTQYDAMCIYLDCLDRRIKRF